MNKIVLISALFFSLNAFATAYVQICANARLFERLEEADISSKIKSRYANGHAYISFKPIPNGKLPFE